MEKFGRRLARRGFAVYNIDYRLAPDHRHPAQIEDVRAAIEHLKVLAEAYPLDLKRVGLLGYSAGGHLALLAAATAKESSPEIRAVMAGGAPVKLSHGRWDLLVEVEQSRLYHQTLLENEVESTLMERRVFGHLATFLFDGPTMRRTVSFLGEALATTLGNPAPHAETTP